MANSLSPFSPEFVEAAVKELARMQERAIALGSLVGGITNGHEEVAGPSPSGVSALTANRTNRRTRSRAAKSAKPTAGMTAKQAASHKLQGRYMGLLRQVGSARGRSHVKAVAKKEGREAAIALMESAAAPAAQD